MKEKWKRATYLTKSNLNCFTCVKGISNTDDEKTKWRENKSIWLYQFL